MSEEAANVTFASNDSAPTATQETEQYFLTIFFGLFVAAHAIVGTIGNAMVIAAIRQSSRLQSKADYFIG